MRPTVRANWSLHREWTSVSERFGVLLLLPLLLDRTLLAKCRHSLATRQTKGGIKISLSLSHFHRRGFSSVLSSKSQCVEPKWQELVKCKKNTHEITTELMIFSSQRWRWSTPATPNLHRRAFTPSPSHLNSWNNSTEFSVYDQVNVGDNIS